MGQDGGDAGEGGGVRGGKMARESTLMASELTSSACVTAACRASSSFHSNSFTDADPLLGTIKSTSFGAVGAIINFAVAFTVSKMTTPIPQEISDLVESVRVPRGAGAAQDH